MQSRVITFEKSPRQNPLCPPFDVRFTSAMQKHERWGVTVLLLFFFIVVLRSAWLCDDAYITLRTVDNLLKGHGLTWNPGERVQTYTHPLWLLILIPWHALTRDGYFGLMLPSLLFSFAALVLLSKTVREWKDYFLALLLLLSSKAFLDFSTSGLENPLSHFLALLFVLFFLTPSSPSSRQTRWAALLACLAALNRPDTLLIFLPALAVLLRPATLRQRGQLLLIFFPLAAWEIFAVIYYGSPFPNTAYAKLGTGIARWDYLVQGLLYYCDGLRRDPATMLLIGAGLILTFRHGSVRERALAAGMTLYLLYIVWIGGDFMSGRFFSTPVLLCVVLLARQFHNVSWQPRLTLALCSLCLAVFFVPASNLTGMSSEKPLADSIDTNGIADERAFYLSATGLTHYVRGEKFPNATFPWVLDGQLLKQGQQAVVVRSYVGLVGFHAGPNVHIIDDHGLTDPFIARLPVADPKNWRIGHFQRPVPEGYMESIRTGKNLIANPVLARLYERLVSVHRGALWTKERWGNIWRLTLGNPMPPNDY